MYDTTEQLIDAINTAAAGGTPTYFGGADLRSAEAIAADYAASCGHDQADESGWGDAALAAEAALEVLRAEGAQFDPTVAGRKAAELLAKAAIADAEQELGEESSIAERVARAIGDNGQQFVLADGGDWVPAIRIEDLAAAAGGRHEVSPDRSCERWEFDDGSAIVACGGGWDIEGPTPFSWRGAE